jgi:hypothetical protein
LAWREKGDFDRALTDLDKTLALDPKYVDAYDVRGWTWYRKREYDKAIAHLVVWQRTSGSCTIGARATRSDHRWVLAAPDVRNST